MCRYKKVTSCFVSMIKKRKVFFLFLFLLMLSSCFQMTSSDQLNTNPVTNNPNLIPTEQTYR